MDSKARDNSKPQAKPTQQPKLELDPNPEDMKYIIPGPPSPKIAAAAKRFLDLAKAGK